MRVVWSAEVSTGLAVEHHAPSISLEILTLRCTEFESHRHLRVSINVRVSLNHSSNVSFVIHSLLHPTSSVYILRRQKASSLTCLFPSVPSFRLQSATVYREPALPLGSFDTCTTWNREFLVVRIHVLLLLGLSAHGIYALEA
jgi:hypothetical protein